jgi:hypothetical protein
MEVFVIPVGGGRYELYCEQATEPDDAPSEISPGVIGRLRRRFAIMLHAAEERRHQTPDVEPHPQNNLERMQERIMAWVAERIAEQRLLWNLRRETAVLAVHPQDMPFDQVLTLVRRTLQRDYERHRLWLGVDTLGLIASAVLTIIPGPNLVAYYFAFRVVGHWLSMRGALQGLQRISWTGRPSPPLSELRDAASMTPETRAARVDDVAARLHLRHLSTFFERVAIPHA